MDSCLIAARAKYEKVCISLFMHVVSWKYSGFAFQTSNLLSYMQRKQFFESIFKYEK